MARGDVMRQVLQRVRSQRRQRGFTLLELLITLSVTTIGLVGLLSLHLSVSRGNDGASRSAEAQQLCVSELEALRAMSFVTLMQTLAGNTPTSFPRTRTANVTGRGGMPFTVTTTLTDIPAVSANLLKIRVVTTWAEDGAAFSGGGGTFDHSLALEVIRTVQEAL
jgi:prepilin-type N-terminal cleavage/methylation domain-containing protein